MKTIHVIPNAHLDPVWLWDWREGLNEGISTVRNVLDLMDEFDELTFIRGEAVIYQHIERYDPGTFARIDAMVQNGRWDLVGGTVLQMDTNLPCTEVLDKQFEVGKKYFRDAFGKEVTVAWAADSFGHSGGLPEILNRNGMVAFAFTRPMPAQMQIDRSAFTWRGVGGSEVLAYRPKTGWYGSERGEVIERLDAVLAEAHVTGLDNIACFIGLGDHGGGPSRRQVVDIVAWRDAHAEVAVKFSGLHRLFDSLRVELAAKPAGFTPIFEGELGYTLRGCFSSAADFKFAYRKAEAQVLRAEKTIRALGGDCGDAMKQAWDGLLFNSFHDILPGSSIERAMIEQRQWVDGVIHQARCAEFDSLNQFQAKIDTRCIDTPEGDMPAAATLLVFNPHDAAFDGYIELEAALDYRPIFSYQDRPAELPVKLLDGRGQPVAFQRIVGESSFMLNVPWRLRVLAPAKLLPREWAVYDLGYVEGASPVPSNASARAMGDNSIANDRLYVVAAPGTGGICIKCDGQPLFGDSGVGFSTFKDAEGSWGDMSDRTIHHNEQLEAWTILSTSILETGPHRASMIITFAGTRSEIDLTVAVTHGSNVVDVSARLFWNDRGARLKLLLPAGDRATFDVPGGQITRGPLGEVPGGRWVVIHPSDGCRDVGFASNALYNFDSSDGVTRATIVRSAPFASDTLPSNAAARRLPTQDRGEHHFAFLITPDIIDIKTRSILLEQPLIIQTVPAHFGTFARKGTIR